MCVNTFLWGEEEKNLIIENEPQIETHLFSVVSSLLRSCVIIYIVDYYVHIVRELLYAFLVEQFSWVSAVRRIVEKVSNFDIPQTTAKFPKFSIQEFAEDESLNLGRQVKTSIDTHDQIKFPPSNAANHPQIVTM